MDDVMIEQNRNVVMLASSNHSPYDTRIFEKEAKSLQSFGFNVSIIIPFEKDEIKSGIHIISVKTPDSGWEKLFITPLRILRKALNVGRASCYHIHDSELLVTGIILKTIGHKVIYDAHEDTPQQLKYQHWIPRLIKPFYILWFRSVEWIAGKIFDRIIVAEPVIAKYFPKHKTSLIRNFPIVARFPVLEQWGKRKDQMVYIGSITKVRGIKEIIDAFTQTGLAIELVLGGTFSPEKLKNEIIHIANVNYLDWLSLDEVNNVLNESKLGLIIPHPIKRYLTNYPVKLFEYMLAGLPVIVTEKSLSADFVHEADCGFAVNPFDSAIVAKAMISVFNNPKDSEKMGKRGRQLILDKYNWENESKTLENLYDKLLLQ